MKNTSIFILGHNGMLGQMAAYYFAKKGYKIQTSTERFNAIDHQKLIDQVKSSKCDYVFNCIGKIKQKTDDVNQLIWANAILPLELINKLDSQKQLLIQPSTDCVFSGKKGDFYSNSDFSDAKDDYGWSKRLGEVALLNKPNVLIIRVSIIGLDKSTEPKGLLGWFLSNKPNSLITGFTNHLWNGITTLEWCKQVDKLLKSNYLQPNLGKIIHLGTVEYYSKFEMLNLFQEKFATNYSIQAHEHQEYIDRRLKPDFISPDLSQQVKELADLNAEWNQK